MLSTSIEYIQALRKGDYLCFLEWPHFLSRHYDAQEEVIDADDTLSLIIFEWLNYGFGDLDIQQMAVISAARTFKPEILQSWLEYSYTSLYSAMIHCMVYLKTQKQDYFKSHDRLTKREAVQLVYKNMKLINSADFLEMEHMEKDRYLKLVTSQDQALIDKVVKSIYPITNIRYLVDDYYTILKTTLDSDVQDGPDEELKRSRVSVLERFAEDLNADVQLTEEVHIKIKAYVDKLWELQPQRFEERYLNSICPPSLLDIAWSFITNYRFDFFNRFRESKILSITDESSHDSKKGDVPYIP